MPATIFISDPNRWWMLAAMVLLISLFYLWALRRSEAPAWVKAASLGLRCLGLAWLAFCLLEPQRSLQRAKPGLNQVILLADNSQSLQIHDPGHPESRGAQLTSLLQDPNSSWIARLEQDFMVRRYSFDSHLRSSDGFAGLDYSGSVSALGSALKSVAELHHDRPSAAVLLFTDGNATDLKGKFPSLSGLPPICPVMIGSDQPNRDLAIQNVTVTQTAFEDTPVTVQASVSAWGFAGSKVVAALYDRQTNLVIQETQTVPARNENLVFRLQFRPQQSRLAFYRLQVSSLATQAPSGTEPPEATLLNNSRMVVVNRPQEEYRILYVAGRPNWEYKFLNRALSKDRQVQLVALIRMANREPKFEFRGRYGERSNPLFRGFDQKDETTERYDQPVLSRLNTKDAAELQGGFPKAPEDLFAYDALIIDDLEAAFFTQDQMALIQKFVAFRGGGLLMLGGQESFIQGKYHQTPIGDLLPVYLNPSDPAEPKGPFRFNLTREGMLQPWARLRNTEPDELRRLEQMPLLGVLNTVRGIRPGALALATVQDAGGRSFPALVAHRFGNGRVAALLVGDLWHWGMTSPEMHEDLDKAWRQIARWLVSDIPKKIDLQTAPSPSLPGPAVTVQVRVRDPKFEPVEDASVTLRVQPVGTASGSGEPIRLTADPSAAEPGLFEATFIPRDTSAYQVDAAVTNSLGAELGRERNGWVTDLAGEEFSSPSANRPFLEQLARQTGGELLTPATLPAFVNRLPFRQAPITETHLQPLWHNPAILIFALACFAAEWGLRRWKGLP